MIPHHFEAKRLPVVHANKIVSPAISWSYNLMSLPPLNGLLALEAVIRLGSVNRAAEELHVSQPAISQRLRALEAFFGRRLIERTPNGFRAESDVEVYAARLQRAIYDMRSASDAFRAQSQRTENRLTIALLATFAQRWLIPRLIDFQQRHPEIDVQLITTSEPARLLREDADISIRCGCGKWDGFNSKFLVANRIFPVASPAFLKACPVRSLKDLRTTVLIRVDASPRAADWPRWLEVHGDGSVEPKAWQTYANSTHALEAATAGLGIAMAHTPFVADSLASGRLIRPFSGECPDADGDYYLVYRAQREVPPRIQSFVGWLCGGSVTNGDHQ